MIQAGRDGGRYRNDPTARTPDELAATTTKAALAIALGHGIARGRVPSVIATSPSDRELTVGCRER